jgi:hypothetical protein
VRKLLAIVTLAVAAYPAAALSLTDRQIAVRIVRQSRTDYYANGVVEATPRLDDQRYPGGDYPLR